LIDPNLVNLPMKTLANHGGRVASASWSGDRYFADEAFLRPDHIHSYVKIEV
jgi:hypothetical protein